MCCDDKKKASHTVLANVPLIGEQLHSLTANFSPRRICVVSYLLLLLLWEVVGCVGLLNIYVLYYMFMPSNQQERTLPSAPISLFVVVGMSRLLSAKYQLLIAGTAAAVTTTIVAVRVHEEEKHQKRNAVTDAAGSLTTPSLDSDSRRPEELHPLPCAVGFQDSSAFLDKHRSTLWELQTSNINAAYLRALTDSSKGTKSFGVEVLRGTTPYATAVTPMRVVGYFPNVSPSALQEYITDQTLRLKWDKNYNMFAVLDSRDASELSSRPDIRQASMTQAIISALKSSAGSGFEQSWACHRVASPLLQKIGIRGKLFQYERTSWKLLDGAAHLIAYRSIVDPAQSYPCNFASDAVKKKPTSFLKMKPSSSTGSPQEEPEHANFCRLLNVFFKRYEKPDDDKVIIHHQTIALLPIIGSSTAPLERAILDARTVGSVTHSSFTDVVARNHASQTESVNTNDNSGAAGIHGTLMIMTSLNETPIPSGIPKWAQKRAAHFFTSQAYEMLYRCALANHHHT